MARAADQTWMNREGRHRQPVRPKLAELKRRRVDNDDNDNGRISLELKLGPPVAEAPRAITQSQVGPTLVQRGTYLTTVNDRVNDGQRSMLRGVGLVGSTRVVGAPQLDPPPSVIRHRIEEVGPAGRSSRVRRRAPPPDRNGWGKSVTIEPPYPWATNRRARVHSIRVLMAKGITVISGDVQCKHCEKTSKLEFNLMEKFFQIYNLVASSGAEMHDRAPTRWMHPNLPTCRVCEHDNSLSPVIAEKKRNINWLFLLLGEMVGCCKLEQLKYFCKHTNNHRTGAKDRVLYLTYVSLCHQLRQL